MYEPRSCLPWFAICRVAWSACSSMKTKRVTAATVAPVSWDSPVKKPGDAIRLAFVIPWRDRGRWLWEHLPESVVGDLLFAAPEPDAGGRRLPPYLGEFLHLARR